MSTKTIDMTHSDSRGVTIRERIEQAMLDYLPDIGQIDKQTRKALEMEVAAGRLIKYKGYWNSGSPIAGLGSLKTIWRAA